MPPMGQSPSEKQYHERKWYCVYVVDLEGVSFHIECDTADEASALKAEYLNEAATARTWINVCRYRYREACPELVEGAGLELPKGEEQSSAYDIEHISGFTADHMLTWYSA